jgi:hypothetical protein
MRDPTREQMLAACADMCESTVDALLESEEAFCCEQAIYWFANDWHAGQASNLYGALCASPYSPGRFESGPEDASLYNYLESVFGDRNGHI